MQILASQISSNVGQQTPKSAKKFPSKFASNLEILFNIDGALQDFVYVFVTRF